jgi:hypothetical protein
MNAALRARPPAGGQLRFGTGRPQRSEVRDVLLQNPRRAGSIEWSAVTRDDRVHPLDQRP